MKTWKRQPRYFRYTRIGVAETNNYKATLFSLAMFALILCGMVAAMGAR